MPLSQAALQAALGQYSAAVFLECLTVEHPDITTLRVVNDTQDLVRSAGTFIGFPFTVKLHAQSDQQVAQADVTFDAVDQRIVTALRGLGSPRPTITYEVVLSDTPNTVEVGPMEFEIVSFAASAGTVTVSMSFALGVLSDAFTKGYFSPWNAA